MTTNWRSTGKLIGKWIFGVLFVLAGVGHFVAPGFYMKIMPPYLPLHRELVLISGVAEILLGLLLLVSKTSWFAAWGLIALLIVVFPANIHVYQHRESFPLLSPLAHLLRLPLQGVLILWAFVYTRR
jgi:uncharacterized membrane protein